MTHRPQRDRAEPQDSVTSWSFAPDTDSSGHSHRIPVKLSENVIKKLLNEPQQGPTGPQIHISKRPGESYLQLSDQVFQMTRVKESSLVDIVRQDGEAAVIYGRATEKWMVKGGSAPSIPVSPTSGTTPVLGEQAESPVHNTGYEMAIPWKPSRLPGWVPASVSSALCTVLSRYTKKSQWKHIYRIKYREYREMEEYLSTKRKFYQDQMEKYTGTGNDPSAVDALEQLYKDIAPEFHKNLERYNQLSQELKKIKKHIDQIQI